VVVVRPVEVSDELVRADYPFIISIRRRSGRYLSFITHLISSSTISSSSTTSDSSRAVGILIIIHSITIITIIILITGTTNRLPRRSSVPPPSAPAVKMSRLKVNLSAKRVSSFFSLYSYFSKLKDMHCKLSALKKKRKKASIIYQRELVSD